MTKVPTPQSVSALLRRSGFKRSVKQASKIKGLREHSEGYQVTRRNAGSVEVRYVPNSFRMRSPDMGRARKLLDGYKEAITAAGYQVTVDSTVRIIDVLYVTTTDPDAKEA